MKNKKILSKNMINKLFTTLLFSLITNITVAQKIANEINTGFEHLDKGEINEAKSKFRKVIDAIPNEYYGYNYLGYCYLKNKEYDSSIFYFNKSIDLNKANKQHSKEMTISSLSKAYLYKRDFKNAFETLVNASRENKYNLNFVKHLKDVCLWSYYIKNEELDINYLSQDMLKSYIVTNAAHEYLIMRIIKIKNHSLTFMNQKYNSKENSDLLTCSVNKTSDSIVLVFKLNWDINKEIGGKSFNPEKFYDNVSNTIWERIGAKLSYDSKTEVLTEVDKLKK